MSKSDDECPLEVTPDQCESYFVKSSITKTKQNTIFNVCDRGESINHHICTRKCPLLNHQITTDLINLHSNV